jgi:hypothetical protein
MNASTRMKIWVTAVLLGIVVAFPSGRVLAESTPTVGPTPTSVSPLEPSPSPMPTIEPTATPTFVPTPASAPLLKTTPTPSPSITIPVTSVALSATISSITSDSNKIVLDAEDQIVHIKVSITVTSPTASGWNLSLAAAPFSDSTNPGQQLSPDSLSIEKCTATPALNGLTACSTATVTTNGANLFPSSVSNSIGVYTIEVVLDLDVAKDTKPGNYTSTFTVTTVQGL